MNTCLKDRYTLIEQSDLDTLIEHSQYSSEEQCSKLIDKEIWLVREKTGKDRKRQEKTCSLGKKKRLAAWVKL